MDGKRDRGDPEAHTANKGLRGRAWVRIRPAKLAASLAVEPKLRRVCFCGCEPSEVPQKACAPGGRPATMRRAAALLAQRLQPAATALEIYHPSTSAALPVAWARAVTSTAAAHAPVHPEEELYNRLVRGRKRRGAMVAARARCSPLPPPPARAEVRLVHPTTLAGSDSSSSWATGCQPQHQTPGWHPTRLSWGMWTCTSG